MVQLVASQILFIVECFDASYINHLRSYEQENTETIKVLEPAQLSDIFPLSAYTIGHSEGMHLPRTDGLVMACASDLLDSWSRLFHIDKIVCIPFKSQGFSVCCFCNVLLLW